jgi:DNA-binding transcriptional ArsR family regulator
MESELDLLLGSAIDSLIKLEVLLHLHCRPGVVMRPEEIAAGLRRSEPELRAGLEELAEAGLIDRFPIGTGRHVIYGPSEDEHVHRLIGLLHERYHRDTDSRSLLVRTAMGHRGDQSSSSEA